jgi:hypothetical protein
MLRLLRLIKLARILRASRIFSRWENHISISYGTQSLIKLFIGVLLMLHWLCELPRAAARERAGAWAARCGGISYPLHPSLAVRVPQHACSA